MARNTKVPQKIDPVFQWLPTRIALIITEKRHPNTPLTPTVIETIYASLTPEERKEVVISAKAVNNEQSKAFLAAAAKITAAKTK